MNPTPATLTDRYGRRIRLGMVGGGLDSVIGDTHRVALRVDGMCELVSGAMSIDPDIARATGRSDLLDPARVHLDYREMAPAEAAREDRIDAVIIATPPHTHLPVAVEFLSRGIDVICEKPLTKDLAEADQLATAVADSGRLLVLTHCYTGYPMVREARHVVASGRLGTIRMVDAQFAGGDSGVAREPADPTLRHWRFRPEVMGRSAILGEVGSHAHNIVHYVTGLQVTEVSAQMDTIAANATSTTTPTSPSDSTPEPSDGSGAATSRSATSTAWPSRSSAMTPRCHGPRKSPKRYAWHRSTGPPTTSPAEWTAPAATHCNPRASGPATRKVTHWPSPTCTATTQPPGWSWISATRRPPRRPCSGCPR
jgi:predicted dehydrogenase